MRITVNIFGAQANNPHQFERSFVNLFARTGTVDVHRLGNLTITGAQSVAGGHILLDGGTLGVGYSRAQLLRISKYPLRAVCFDSEPAAQERARQLCEELGDFVCVVPTARDKLKGDALAAAQAWVGPVASKLPDADVLIDAVFGSGLSRNPAGAEAAAIAAMNEARARGARS